ncbi:type II toxin-antitoxin system VapC family toxin [Dyadobacter sp. CY343]|uniref:type II toxin-antitoxin system VapC family toxin n=1 Tax=Dyadobacter sp. CY343 TaxID=2907299 RepID=UPI001F26ADE5|nr:type II toxin-antitoxin system VapC family toxin [Dyadobacter sp. CY343]MCE7062983.1 type II toxin-antitoxin system VapC family toxin [Dyadobacter sp. CY343]
MRYFDSHVIFNYVVVQDYAKNQRANRLILDAITDARFVISTLVVQELGYGLARFDLEAKQIRVELEFLTSLNISTVSKSDLNRALQLAEMIGFKHIKDCIHTAVAENLECESLYTYNKSDFRRIQKFTDLEIIIL